MLLLLLALAPGQAAMSQDTLFVRYTWLSEPDQSARDEAATPALFTVRIGGETRTFVAKPRRFEDVLDPGHLLSHKTLKHWLSGESINVFRSALHHKQSGAFGTEHGLIHLEYTEIRELGEVLGEEDARNSRTIERWNKWLGEEETLRNLLIVAEGVPEWGVVIEDKNLKVCMVDGKIFVSRLPDDKDEKEKFGTLLESAVVDHWFGEKRVQRLHTVQQADVRRELLVTIDDLDPDYASREEALDKLAGRLELVEPARIRDLQKGDLDVEIVNRGLAPAALKWGVETSDDLENDRIERKYFSIFSDQELEGTEGEGFWIPGCSQVALTFENRDSPYSVEATLSPRLGKGEWNLQLLLADPGGGSWLARIVEWASGGVLDLIVALLCTLLLLFVLVYVLVYVVFPFLLRLFEMTYDLCVNTRRRFRRWTPKRHESGPRGMPKPIAEPKPYTTRLAETRRATRQASPPGVEAGAGKTVVATEAASPAFGAASTRRASDHSESRPPAGTPERVPAPARPQARSVTLDQLNVRAQRLLKEMARAGRLEPPDVNPLEYLLTRVESRLGMDLLRSAELEKTIQQLEQKARKADAYKAVQLQIQNLLEEIDWSEIQTAAGAGSGSLTMTNLDHEDSLLPRIELLRRAWREANRQCAESGHELERTRSFASETSAIIAEHARSVREIVEPGEAHPIGFDGADSATAIRDRLNNARETVKELREALEGTIADKLSLITHPKASAADLKSLGLGELGATWRRALEAGRQLEELNHRMVWFSFLSGVLDSAGTELERIAAKEPTAIDYLSGTEMEPVRIAKELSELARQVEVRWKDERLGIVNGLSSEETDDDSMKRVVGELLCWLLEDRPIRTLTCWFRFAEFVRAYGSVLKETVLRPLVEGAENQIQFTQLAKHVFFRLGVEFERIRYLRPISSDFESRFKEDPAGRPFVLENDRLKEILAPMVEGREWMSTLADVDAWGRRVRNYPSLNHSTIGWLWHARDIS